ncbi:MAG: hypothetical protein AAF609_01425 [Cyanobacteria bacterium P01_C01_bin.120]
MKTDIDDATGVTTQEADKAEQSTRNAVGLLVGAAALLYYRNQQSQAAEPDKAISPEPIAVEVRPDIQDLGHPRPLPGGPDDLPPYDAHELPPAGGTTPPDETLHTAYRPEKAPVVIRLSVGDEQIETDSERIASDIQQLDNLDVVQRAITNQSLTSDLVVEIQVAGDLVFYQGPEERYVHSDFDLQAANELISNHQHGEMERNDGAVIDVDASPLHTAVGRVDREVPDVNPEATQEQVSSGNSTPPIHADRAPTQERSHSSAPEQPVDTTPPPVDQEQWTIEIVPLSQAEAIAGQNEGDVSTDDPAIWIAQPTTPTVTKDGHGRIVPSPSMEGLEATVDLVERREEQAEWMQARLEEQQALATMLDRCLETTHGKEGSATIIGNSYDISRDGHGGLAVTAKDGRGLIFERDGQSGEIISSATSQDLETFAKGAAVLERQQARNAAMSSPTPAPSPSISRSRQSDIEIG